VSRLVEALGRFAEVEASCHVFFNGSVAEARFAAEMPMVEALHTLGVSGERRYCRRDALPCVGPVVGVVCLGGDNLCSTVRAECPLRAIRVAHGEGQACGLW
jgi:hypothetical protein